MSIAHNSSSVSLLRLVAVLAVLLLINGGCVSSEIPGSAQYINLPVAISNATADEARVYVLRPDMLKASKVTTVYDENQLIGKLTGGGYLCWDRAPGDATIKMDEDVLSFTALAGNEYFIVIIYETRTLGHGPSVKFVNNSWGQVYLNWCRPPHDRSSDNRALGGSD